MRPALRAAIAALVLPLCGCEPASAPGRLRELMLPIGQIDSPAPGVVAPGDVLVSGWAVAEGGVDDVAVYLDGKYVDSAVLGFDRPDVAQSRPGDSQAAKSGFRVHFPATKLVQGDNWLIVQVRSRKGATRDIAAITLRPAP